MFNILIKINNYIDSILLYIIKYLNFINNFIDILIN